MIISTSWLRDWVDFQCDVDTLAEGLTMVGLEVGSIEPIVPISRQIVVGSILAIQRHPVREKLHVCEVSVGKTRALQIVCGASNVRIGIKVPIALLNSKLPSGVKVDRTLIGGVKSCGIICSGAELGLEDSSDDILELEDTAVIGRPVTDHLDLNDTLLDIELTPNRGDCLSMLGIAREVSAITGARLMMPRIRKMPPVTSNSISISLSERIDCPRYIGRILGHLNVGSQTPDWMKERLRRSGIRSLGSPVDITNYVMLELGQPLHAFDLDRLQGQITVRHSKNGEALELLDGTSLHLLPETLVIADERCPVALAGIMGGKKSAVVADTQNVFLEAAYFRPGIISERARIYGLQTDASYRFERGVDPTMQRWAIERATKYLVDICGGIPGPICETTYPSKLPKGKTILLRQKRLGRVLGVQVPTVQISKILKDLGMKVKRETYGWKVLAPDHRFDINGEHDLLEEIARLYGYGNIQSRPPRLLATQSSSREKEIPLQQIQDRLITREYNEIITYSFVDSILQSRIDPAAKSIRLSNPISSNMDVMRTSLWYGLLMSVGINQRRHIRRIRLFETGHVFAKKGRRIEESHRLGAVACGPANQSTWESSERLCDFFDIKGDLEALLGLNAGHADYQFRPSKHPALHPGQSAEIRQGVAKIGYIGRLHPEIQTLMDIDFPVYLFEIDLARTSQRTIPSYRPVSRFPVVSRDVSIVIAESISAEVIRRAIISSGGNLLNEVRVFDVYRGRGVKKGEKSLSFSLTLQSSSRNLTETEADEIIKRIMTTIKALGGQLRAAPNQQG